MVCEICNKEKEDVELLENPYRREIDCVSEEMYLCEDCYDRLAEDI